MLVQRLGQSHYEWILWFTPNALTWEETIRKDLLSQGCISDTETSFVDVRYRRPAWLAGRGTKQFTGGP